MCFGGGGATLTKSQAEKDLEDYETPDYGPLPSLGTSSSYEIVRPKYEMAGGVTPRSLLLPVRRS